MYSECKKYLVKMGYMYMDFDTFFQTLIGVNETNSNFKDVVPTESKINRHAINKFFMLKIHVLSTTQKQHHS